MLKRGNLALEEGRWDDADGYFERVLEMDAENALAYLGMLMAEFHIHTKAELADQAEPFDNNQKYARVLRFADVGLKDQLEEYNRNIRYHRACLLYTSLWRKYHLSYSHRAAKGSQGPADRRHAFSRRFGCGLCPAGWV